MFLSSISEMWVSIAEGIAYGWDWLMTNGGNLVEYLFYILTSSGVLTGVIAFIKLGLPLLRNSNKPVLNELGIVLQTVQTLAEQQQESNARIEILQEENKTLKEYLLLASEANQTSLILSQEMREKFGYLAEGLKATENAIAIDVAEKVENAIEDDTLTTEEIVEIAEELPEVENVLGMTLQDIELKLKGE
jgi:predicted DNA-binding protein